MQKRWQDHLANVPQVDKDDMINDNPNFNGGKQCFMDTVHQHAAEFSQMSYLRMRSMEEAFSITDYLDPKCNPDYNTFLKSSSRPDLVQAYQRGRASGIQKIMHLHQEKGYKIETLFMACSIFDRYLALLGHWNFPINKIVNLSTICILMAAKLEQPMQPSFSRMISLLNDSEKKQITKQDLVHIESDILLRFGFDFNFPGPIDSMQRYLRLVSYDTNKSVWAICEQLSRFQLNYSVFLKYKPSQIAACVVILSINLAKKNDQTKELQGSSTTPASPKSAKNSFFDKCKLTGQNLLNVHMWNNPDVMMSSGYAIEMIKEPLFLLAQCLKDGMKSNQLEDFNIEQIKSLKNFKALISEGES